MKRVVRFIGKSFVAGTVLLAAAVLSDSLFHQLATTTHAAPLAVAQEAAQKEADTRKDVVNEVVDVGETLQKVQSHLETGDVGSVKSDIKRLQSQFKELSELCVRWETDLNRLNMDATKVFDEWTAVVDGIQAPEHRIKEAERLTRSKARFRDNLERAEVALSQVKGALASYADVEKIIKSATELAPAADGITNGLAALTESAVARTSAFRSAATAVLTVIDKIEGSVHS